MRPTGQHISNERENVNRLKNKVVLWLCRSGGDDMYVYVRANEKKTKNEIPPKPTTSPKLRRNYSVHYSFLHSLWIIKWASLNYYYLRKLNWRIYVHTVYITHKTANDTKFGSVYTMEIKKICTWILFYLNVWCNHVRSFSCYSSYRAFHLVAPIKYLLLDSPSKFGTFMHVFVKTAFSLYI